MEGGQRWWDGAQWGQFAPHPAAAYTPATAAQPQSMEESGKTVAIFCHVGHFLLNVFLALIFRVTEGDKNPYVKHHATEALNFQLTQLILTFGLMIVGIPLAIVTAGIFLILLIPAFILIVILGIVWTIQGAIAASRGEWYRYPFSFRMVSGARPAP